MCSLSREEPVEGEGLEEVEGEVLEREEEEKGERGAAGESGVEGLEEVEMERSGTDADPNGARRPGGREAEGGRMEERGGNTASEELEAMMGVVGESEAVCSVLNEGIR